MGISFKLLCPGDVPAKAHKMILNETTSVLYEHICLEKHRVEVWFDLWKFDYAGFPLIDNNTNELILRSLDRVWGQYDRMLLEWEILLRKLLHKNCIEKTQITNEKLM